ncbi:MAG: phosphotransferase [Kofleriaceae bacterium]|nr:phosphotransferase [Kofleriaceae bacterium]
MSTLPALPPGLRQRLHALFPDAEVVAARALSDDDGGGKELGYGRPIYLAVRTGGVVHELVFHTCRADDFGHDRRADRLGNLVLAADTFATVPGHVDVIDVGVIADRGPLISLAGTGEAYLITRWAAGAVYADDLRRIARAGAITARDLARTDRLVATLLALHAQPGSHPGAYTRAVRDLLGHGEGVFGLVDSYPADVPAAPLTRLRRIEEACLDWRWRLRDQHHRLRRTHGDFHPFNLVFADDDSLAVLDASRGCEGDPADDVACLAINYLFFGGGLDPAGASRRWADGLGQLWRRLWSGYLAAAEVDVLAAVAPFLAWRGLVLSSPRWYPHVTATERDRILTLVERALASPRFDPAWGEEVMT